MIQKFRKKPVIIEAVKWDGTFSHSKKIKELFPELQTLSQSSHEIWDTCSHWKIGTLEGGHEVSVNDYIIKGIKGEFYPCKPDIFELTYEKV